MKHLAKNPFFYLSIALMFVVAFEVVNLVRAQYVGPTAPPPGGQPYPPLDLSPVGQEKTGFITTKGNLTTEGDLTMAGPNGTVSVSSVAGVPVLTFSNGSANGKLWLAPMGGGTIMAHSGGKDFEIGTGSGTASNSWTAISGGILYSGGNVTINNSNSGSQTGFWATGETVGSVNNYDQFKMPCDTSVNNISPECKESFYADPGTGSYVQGQKYYDGYQTYDQRGIRRTLYKVFIFETRANAGTNTAVLNVGDIRLSSGVPVTPPGTWCGFARDGDGGGNALFTCYGHNPKVSCPKGYERSGGFGKDVWGGDDAFTCVKG